MTETVRGVMLIRRDRRPDRCDLGPLFHGGLALYDIAHKGLEVKMSTETVRRSDPVGPRDGLESFALASIQRWRRIVIPLPLTAQSEDQETKLRGLVAWYERVCGDDRYSSAAPVEGIEALLAIALGSTLHDLFVSMAREAIRVAEELVRYRQLMRDSGRADPRSREIARARLELSISTARERFEQL